MSGTRPPGPGVNERALAAEQQAEDTKLGAQAGKTDENFFGPHHIGQIVPLSLVCGGDETESRSLSCCELMQLWAFEVQVMFTTVRTRWCLQAICCTSLLLVCAVVWVLIWVGLTAEYTDDEG